MAKKKRWTPPTKTAREEINELLGKTIEEAIFQTVSHLERTREVWGQHFGRTFLQDAEVIAREHRISTEGTARLLNAAARRRQRKFKEIENLCNVAIGKA